jgi:hypothetical protein
MLTKRAAKPVFESLLRTLVSRAIFHKLSGFSGSNALNTSDWPFISIRATSPFSLCDNSFAAMGRWFLGSSSKQWPMDVAQRSNTAWAVKFLFGGRTSAFIMTQPQVRTWGNKVPSPKALSSRKRHKMCY